MITFNRTLKLKRSECTILPLVLKGTWFDMIASGEKREEYRDATRYWLTRMMKWTKQAYERKALPVVEFRRGYASHAPRIAFVAKHLPLGYWVFYHISDHVLHPEWGERAVPRYVITMGERVEWED